MKGALYTVHMFHPMYVVTHIAATDTRALLASLSACASAANDASVLLHCLRFHFFFRLSSQSENQQVIKMRQTFNSNVRFMLMNSFSTSEDTLEFLKKYPELANDPNLELVQV